MGGGGGDTGRVVAGVGTGGLSEVARMDTGGGFGGSLGTLGGMFGAGGGQGGSGIAGPQLAPVQQAVTNADMRKAERGVNYNLQGQTNLLNALERQGGLNKQRAVYDNQEALMQALNQANGVGTQNAAIQGLQNTAGMYGNIASGQGPNPAMAMLNQQTGNNIANQTAMMAGQRGAGQNAGMIARQAAQQGGALQQNAVGQGATMQANQQLNALSGLANTQQMFGNIGGAQVGQLQGQQAAAANQANQLAGQQIAQTNQNTQAALGNQGQMQNALGAYNSANIANQGNVNSSNSGAAQSRMGNQGQVLGGLMDAGGMAAGMAHGGQVGQYAQGGEINDAQLAAENPPLSAFGQALMGGPMLTQQVGIDPAKPIAKPKETNFSAPQAAAPESQTMAAANTGTLSEAAPSMTPTFTAAEGGLAESGGHVKAKGPGQKAVASGDDYANDKIPAKLSEGEIVLPRSVTMSEDPIGAASEFVRKTLAERSSKSNHLAEGGEPEPEEETLLAEAPTQDWPQGEKPTPAPLTNTEVTLPQSQQTPPGPQAPVAPQPQAAPVEQAKPEMPDLNSPEARAAAHQQFVDDLQYGKIKRQSYSDLYGKKDTLGKVGTIFGLLLSGAGSGLTGKENGLLRMMDSEIEADFQSQLKNKENARNFLTLQDQMTNSRVNQAQTEQNVLNSQYDQWVKMGGDPDASPEIIKDFQARNRKIWDQVESKANFRAALFNDLSQEVGKTGNPTAKAKLAEAGQYFQNQNINDYKRGQAGTAALVKGTNERAKTAPKPAQGSVQWKPIANFAVMENAIKKGIRSGGAANKGNIRPGDVDKVREEMKNVDALNNLYKDYIETFSTLKQEPKGGQVGPMRRALASGAKAIGSLFNAPDAGEAMADEVTGPEGRKREAKVTALMKRLGVDENTMDSILPGWKDEGKDVSYEEVLQAGKDFFNAKLKDMTPTLRGYKEGGLPNLYGDLPDIQYKDMPKTDEKKVNSSYSKYGFEKVK